MKISQLVSVVKHKEYDAELLGITHADGTPKFVFPPKFIFRCKIIFPSKFISPQNLKALPMFVVPSKICLPKNNSFFPQNL
jgi:hypothetical protein